MGAAKKEGEEMSNTDAFIGKIRAVGIKPSDFLLLEVNPEHIMRMSSLQQLMSDLHNAGFKHVSLVLCSDPMRITSTKKAKNKK